MYCKENGAKNGKVLQTKIFAPPPDFFPGYAHVYTLCYKSLKNVCISWDTTNVMQIVHSLDSQSKKNIFQEMYYLIVNETFFYPPNTCI